MTVPEYLAALPLEWRKIFSWRRSMPHYKPAALLVLMDMIEAGEALGGRVDFRQFEQRFKCLLGPFDGTGSTNGWEPFLHLALGDGLWKLTHNGEPLDGEAASRLKTRAQFRRFVDGGIMAPGLDQEVLVPGTPHCIREAVYAVLGSDTWLKSRALLEAVAPDGAAKLPAVPISIDFEVGQVYDRGRDIHARFGGQDQGGISTPTRVPLIFLFTGNAGQQYGYSDEWGDDGVYHYVGEGQIGDMQFRAGNKAIRDHVKNGKDLLVFRKVGKGAGYRYVGQFVCVSEPRSIDGPDLKGNTRKVIVFDLVPADSGNAADTPGRSSQADTPADAALSLQELRVKALEASTPMPQASSSDGKRLYYARSQDVKAYVLARANGVCECCRKPACLATIRTPG